MHIQKIVQRLGYTGMDVLLSSSPTKALRKVGEESDHFFLLFYSSADLSRSFPP